MNLEEMRAAVAQKKNKSYRLTQDEQALRALATEDEEEQKRIDAELLERLMFEADVARMKLSVADSRPMKALCSPNAHKLGAPGWIVVGPADAGRAIGIMKRTGQWNPKEGGVKVLETDPDVMISVLDLAILASPEGTDVEAGRRAAKLLLEKAPPFMRIAYSTAEELGGGAVEEVKGKSRG